jgi:hypothetical protein
MASRVIAAYVEVLQTDGGSIRVSQVGAEALLGDNTARKARVSQVGAEALLSYAHTPGTGPLRFGTPTVYTASGVIATSTSITTHLQRFSGSGLLVGALLRSQNSPSNPQTVAATWNSVSLTAAWSTLSPVGGKAFAWTGWLPAAAQGYQTLALTFGQTQQDIVLFAVEVWGYDPGGAIGATGNTFSNNANASATTSASVTTTAARSGVIGFGWASNGTVTVPAMGSGLVLASNGNSGNGNTSDESAGCGFGYRSTAGSFTGTWTPAAQDASQGLALIELKADPSWYPADLIGTAALSLTATGSLQLATPVPRHLNLAALGLTLTATATLSMATPRGGTGGGGGVGAWLFGTGYSVALPGHLPMMFFGQVTQATNSLANPNFTGAAVGVTPSDWTLFDGSGISGAVTGVGTSWLDVRYSGSNSSGDTAYVGLIDVSAAAASGQSWRLTAGMALVAGELGTTTAQLIMNEVDAGAGYLAGTGLDLDDLTGTVRPFSVSHAFADPSAAKAGAGLQLIVPDGATLDVTLRFEAPRLLRTA